MATGPRSVWISDDAQNWRSAAWPQATHTRGPVAFGNGKFVMLAAALVESLVYVSTNAETWELLSTSLPRGVSGLRFEHGHFLVFGRDGTIFSSVDGNLWLERPSATAWDLRDVTTFSESIVAVADYGVVLESGPFTDSGPAIIKQPVRSQIGLEGTRVMLEVGARGTSPLHYQWRWKGAPIAGATNAVFSLPLVNSSTRRTRGYMTSSSQTSLDWK